jgi:cyclohexadieny/prephenate dehydrogenase
MKPRVLAIVGVGLIGGSVGLAVRRIGDMRVLGVDPDPAALSRARENHIVHEICADLSSAASVADLVLFCTPVDLVTEQVLAAATACRPGTVLSDVGSTKAGIHRSLQDRLPINVPFVGGHPLAGSEKQGSESARADLFRDRVVILTLTPDTDAEAVGRVSSFWQSLGARVQQMSPEAHDRAVALTSHLPHLMASVLAGMLPSELAGLAASGFRDTTRVAAGDPQLWSAILDANRSEILSVLARFEDRIGKFRKALEAGDREAVRSLLEAGREGRSAIIPGA